MENQTTKQNLTIWYLLTIILALFSYYYGLGSYPLLDNNEGLYASIAQQMLLSKSFIIPHLNCLPYLEKPPLLYWLLSGSFTIFGFNAFAARLITTSAGFLICIALLCFSNKIKQPQTGLLATLIFATSVGVIVIARTVYFDMLLTLFITLALLSLYYWLETAKKIALRLAYLAVALGILTKGLVALALVFFTTITYLIITKQWRKLIQLFDFPGILLFLAVVLPWHIAAAIKHHGFAWYYIINEQFLRFLNQRVPHDYYEGPIYYYLPRIAIYLAPWSLTLPLLLVQWKTNFATAWKKFLWCWFLIPLIFFSLSQAKANYYMIVSMPALAWLLGDKLFALLNSNKTRLVNIFLIVILILILSAAIVVPEHFKDSITLRLLQPQILFLILFTVGTLFLIYFNRNKVWLPIVLFAAIIIPTTIIAVTAAKLEQNNISAFSTGLYIKQQKLGGEFYLYQDFEKYSALAFYSGQCLKIIDSQSNDLFYAKSLPEFSGHFLTTTQLHAKTKYSIIVAKNKAQQLVLATKIKVNTIVVLGNLCILGVGQ